MAWFCHETSVKQRRCLASGFSRPNPAQSILTADGFDVEKRSVSVRAWCWLSFSNPFCLRSSSHHWNKISQHIYTILLWERFSGWRQHQHWTLIKRENEEKLGSFHSPSSSEILKILELFVTSDANIKVRSKFMSSVMQKSREVKRMSTWWGPDVGNGLPTSEAFKC